MNTFTLAATGDISFGHTDKQTWRKQGAQYPFEHALPVLAAADLRFGNFESVMIPPSFPADRLNKRALQSDDFVMPSLKAAGYDILNMATNHVLDCGRAGLDHTFKCIRDAGAVPLGAGPEASESTALRTFERNGITIGFLGYLEPANWTLTGCAGRVNYFSLPRAIADIEKYRDTVDVLAVSLHAGLEFCDVPSRPRRTACRAMAAAGAKLVLCHHAHVPQGIERHEGCLIAYGLGNFRFAIDAYLKNSSPHVYHNHILLLTIGRSGVETWERKPFRTQDDAAGRPCPLPPDAVAGTAAHYARLDRLLQNEEDYTAVWHKRCSEYLRAYWQWITAPGPEAFVRDYGWRLLALPENENWTAGIREMAEKRYDEVRDASFEFDRPNSQFEKDGRIF